MPKKKDRVITLRVSEDDFNVVESFAKAKGLSVSSYINSVIKSQTEYFIPTASNEKVSIPKNILYPLFSYASKENLDDLANQWAIEQEHVARLLWGEINLHALLDVIFKISKYMMGTDARVVTGSNFTKDAGYNEGKDLSAILNHSGDISGIKASDSFWVVIRHNLGKNYSYFWNNMFIKFLGLLQNSVDFTTEYDETTISIRLKVKK
ncbi:MAG: hypothetical protein WCF07_13510 [Nitrososphaeraceae archaeon]